MAKDKEQPDVPAPSFDTGSLTKPLSTDEYFKAYEQLAALYPDMLRQGYDVQLEYAPAIDAAQVANQEALYRSMTNLATGMAPQYAITQDYLARQYAPEFYGGYQSLYGSLFGGGQLSQDLDVMRQAATTELGYGYELGAELTREVEQGIRASQAARGNYLGPAATAEEVMGKGSASIDLYNQRFNQYGQFLNSSLAFSGLQQNYLQGANPLDQMGKIAASTMGTSFYPTSNIDASLGGQGFSDITGAASNIYGTSQTATTGYNSALLGAFDSNTEAAFNTYDRTYEQYLEELAIENGLFSSGSTGGGGGGTMALAGSAIGAVGAIGGGLLVF